MNRDEAKRILLTYRPGTADDADPQVVAALALAKTDAKLTGWLEAHQAQQKSLREIFRQIPVPAGLKEQIISEQRAKERRAAFPRRAWMAATAVLVVLVLVIGWFHFSPGVSALAIYENQMAGLALRGYAMDLTTNDVAAIRGYLAENLAPADFVLPRPLQKVEVAGCAIQSWQGVKVSMVCFRTSKPLPPGQGGDLWLFVVDQNSIADAPADAQTRFTVVSQLAAATWVKDGKLYLLGVQGDRTELQRFL